VKAFVSIMIVLVLFSCKKEEGETTIVSRGYEYTPTTEGLEREYLVQEINRFGSTKDTTTFYLKEVIGNSFTSGNEVVTELWRYKKLKIEDSYVFDSLWDFRVRDDFTIISESAIKRVEIGFPVYNDVIFDENQYNTSESFNLFQKKGLSKTVTGGVYSNCVSTFRNDLSNLIETISQEHYFAKNVGLIYSEKIDLSHQPGGDTIGSYYIKELISFEKK
jgi:hypothetical protein